MKHLISVAFALAMGVTPAMGSITEVVIPEKVLDYCDTMRYMSTGSCEIKPEERRLIFTLWDTKLQLWELCPVAGISPGWHLDVLDEAHTQVFKCPIY